MTTNSEKPDKKIDLQDYLNTEKQENSMNQSEIRLRLLELAHRIEYDKVSMKRHRLESMWFVSRDINMQNRSQVPDFPEVAPVAADDVISTAETLDAFLSKKDT